MWRQLNVKTLKITMYFDDLKRNIQNRILMDSNKTWYLVPLTIHKRMQCHLRIDARNSWKISYTFLFYSFERIPCCHLQLICLICKIICLDQTKNKSKSYNKRTKNVYYFWIEYIKIYSTQVNNLLLFILFKRIE